MNALRPRLLRHRAHPRSDRNGEGGLNGFGSIIRSAAAAAVLGLSFALPAMGQQHNRDFVERSAPEYDGLGRKKSRKTGGLRHSEKHRTTEWREYARRVVATHSTNPFTGKPQTDPRHNKYLHAHARRLRALTQHSPFNARERVGGEHV